MSHWLDAHELAFYVVTSWINFLCAMGLYWCWRRAARARDRARDALATAVREFARREGARSHQSPSPNRSTD